jgi:lactoylglutathione lyase
MIQFSHIIYYVKNVRDAVDFYQKAFDMQLSWIHESGTYAELATGHITLAFAHDALGADNLPDGYHKNDVQLSPPGCEIAFTTDDVDAAVKKALQAGAMLLVPVKQKPWGQAVAYVRDPQGILIEIASKM